MSTVRDHYENHLAPVYLWMAGGIEHALAVGTSDVAPFLERPGVAVDLGAGFGMHSIPLARAGFDVLAIDTSPLLLTELRKYAGSLPVATINADLLEFPAHIHRPADLILCMGDTLTHLRSTHEVARLMKHVAKALRPGGQFIATFRDYRQPPLGDRRFISVRSDPERILTCYVEARGTRVLVHDIIHECAQDGWAMKVSSYAKLRLSPDTVTLAAKEAGMRCRVEPGPRGMLKVLTQVLTQM